MEMSNEKYYVPKIEEFHVGFEYEISCTSDKGEQWIGVICSVDTINTVLENESLDRLYRVKSLDREDIEAEGLEINENETEHLLNQFCFYGNGGDALVYFDANTGIVKMQKYIGKYSEPVFQGTIKNRSELRKVMEMIGITK